MTEFLILLSVKEKVVKVNIVKPIAFFINWISKFIHFQWRILVLDTKKNLKQ